MSAGGSMSAGGPTERSGRKDPVRAAARLVGRLPVLLLVLLVRAYQLVVSPLLGPSCRFYPSCSAYGLEALRVHGAVRGSWLTVRRLLRCHPWNPGGVDEVPPARAGRTHRHQHA